MTVILDAISWDGTISAGTMVAMLGISVTILLAIRPILKQLDIATEKAETANLKVDKIGTDVHAVQTDLAELRPVKHAVDNLSGRVDSLHEKATQIGAILIQQINDGKRMDALTQENRDLDKRIRQIETRGSN